jgi:hypothetical protein
MVTGIGRGKTMTAKDELRVLTLLLTLAAMLYLVVWFIEGPPFPQEDPAVTPVEVAAQSHHVES